MRKCERIKIFGAILTQQFAYNEKLILIVFTTKKTRHLPLHSDTQ